MSALIKVARIPSACMSKTMESVSGKKEPEESVPDQIYDLEDETLEEDEVVDRIEKLEPSGKTAVDSFSVQDISDAGIDASASSTALRNIILRSAKAGKNYKQILGDIVKNQDQLTSSMDEFGIRAAVPATILAGKLNETLTLSNDILNDTGSASIAAAKQLDTLKGRVTLLGSAYEGFILSLDDGTGAMSGFLKKTVEVVTEMLALASGTAKAKDQLNKAQVSIRKIAKTANFLLKVVKWLVIAYVAFKTVLIATKIVMAAYNIIVGIQAALFGTLTRGIIANNIALGAYTVVSKIATAAQWLMNTAFYGFPLVWILAALAAVVAAIVYLVKNWDEVTKSMVDDWERVKTTFEKEGFGGIFKMWGQELLIWVIDPLISIMALIARITKGKHGVDSLNDLIESKNRLLKETGRGDEMLVKKRIKPNDYNYSGNIPSEMLFSNKSFAGIETKEDGLIKAINKNSEELKLNTNAANVWKGRFSTSILRDANISERTSGIVQRELATTAINNEENVINNQKEVISGAVATPTVNRRSNNVNGTINLIVENRTDGGIGIEVEGTGINVTTTGND